MDFGLVAGGLLKATLPKVAGAIATAVKNKLHPSELQRSLEVGLRKSGAFDQGQKANNAVFYHWEPGKTDKFLAALLEHPEVQRELQKPLEQDGSPDVAILVQAAKHIAADRNLDIQDETLEPWLKAFANAYFDEITAIRFQVAKADYLEQLANWFDDVKFAGVAVPGQDVERAERLAQIFVMPDVEEDGGGRSRLALERSFLEEQGEQGRQGELLQEQRMRAQLERSGRKFSARQLLNQHQKKVVLLGAPGSGKTTLMSFFAVTLAERQGATAIVNDTHTEGLDRDRTRMVPDAEGIDRLTQGTDRDRAQMQLDTTQMYPDTEGLRPATLALQTDADALPLPILIRIRDWARTPDVTIPEYARQFAETTMSCKPLPKGFFEYWLDNGRSLILLDGLDEVAEESKRYHLVQCIENFLGQYPQNRAIITSRPAGYKHDFFRTEEFPHYELQPFDDGKIEEFCDRWYRSRIQDTAEALRRRESLQKALNQQDRIKLLARNPLLLTIIALIHRYQARLPRERYKLYDKAVETLLTAWDDNKELSNQTVLQYLQLDDLRRLMESLAYWIHTQGNTGDREGGTLIDKDELIQKLTQEIKALKQLQHYEAKAEAERFVKFIRDRTGLLNEQGQDCYAFVHKTFQEYLAAQDINYQADNEDDFELVLTHIEQHLHDAHWREVLLLLIAQQSPKKAARAIRKVLTANSSYEQWLHRDLFFAGRCLAEDPKGLRGADPKLPLEVSERLLELEMSYGLKGSNKVRSYAFLVFSGFHESDFESDALNLLETLESRIGKIRLQEYKILFGKYEEAIKILIKLLVDEDLKLSQEAALVLRKVTKNEISELQVRNVLEHYVARLTELLHDKIFLLRSNNGDSRLYRTTAEVLGKMGRFSKDSESVLHNLLQMLASKDSHVRSAGATGLGWFDNKSEEILQPIVEFLLDSNIDEGDRSYAAYALYRLRTSNSETILRAFLDVLKNGEQLWWAVEVLSHFNQQSEALRRELSTLLEDATARPWGILALSYLGEVSDIEIQELLALLKSENVVARFTAIDALGKLSGTSENIVQVLLPLLEAQNCSDEESSYIAKTLGQFGNASESVVQALLALLGNSASWVCQSAAEALGKLGKRSNQVEPAIVQWIEQHQDEECVGAGIDALWEIVEGEG